MVDARFRSTEAATHWAAMSPSARADQLRRRAADLRSLATDIECTPALSLDHHAGDTTWIGPRPELCRVLLASARRHVLRAADDLMATAVRYELRADELDAIAGAGPAG